MLILKRLGLIIGACALLAISNSAYAQKELSLANFIPVKHPMNSKVFAPLAEEIAKITGSQITVRIYPSGELGAGPKRQYNRVITGVADISFGLQGYTSSQFPRTLAAELPGMFDSPEAAVEVLWNKFDLIEQDYKKTKVLAVWVNSASVLLTRDRAVERVEDLSGLTIRAPSAIGAKVLEVWGANAVTMPAPQIYNALQTGVIDGVFIGSDAVKSFRLDEVTSFATYGVPTTVTTFFLLMNQDSWNGLSASQQQQISSVIGRPLSKHATEVYVASGAASRKHLEGLGDYKVLDLATDQRNRMFKLLSDLYGSVASDLEASGIDGKAIIKGLSGR